MKPHTQRAQPLGNVLQWYATVREENAGGPLQIAFHLEADYGLDNCLAIHQAVSAPH